MCAAGHRHQVSRSACVKLFMWDTSVLGASESGGPHPLPWLAADATPRCSKVYYTSLQASLPPSGHAGGEMRLVSLPFHSDYQALLEALERTCAPLGSTASSGSTLDAAPRTFVSRGGVRLHRRRGRGAVQRSCREEWAGGKQCRCMRPSHVQEKRDSLALLHLSAPILQAPQLKYRLPSIPLQLPQQQA